MGILLGVILGDYAHSLRPAGQLYVMLLEVAVYPYLICSLLHGLGSMAPAQAWRLFLAGWKFYAALWVVTFGLLILLAQGIPQALPTSWLADRAVKDSPSLLEILIPSDPFTALSRNYVPAVVLFCLFYGVALQHVPEKTALLSVLEGIRLASLKFWNVVVRFAPLAVFALFADLAGTIRPRAMEEVSLTEDRLLQFKASTPYLQSPLALFMSRERVGGFTSRAKIVEREGVKIGVFDDPVLVPRLKRTFPNAEIVVVPDYRQVPDFSKIDAAIWTLVQAEAAGCCASRADSGGSLRFGKSIPPSLSYAAGRRGVREFRQLLAQSEAHQWL